MIAWTIEAAQGSRTIDRLVLTSEDPEIIETARRYGLEAPFVRPDELARDETPVSEAVLHAVEMIPGYDYVVVLQVTTPLRLAEDIDACVEKCISHGAESCMTVVRVEESPYWMYTEDRNGYLKPLLSSGYVSKRRQDVPEVYIPNGSIYVARCDYLINHRSLVGNQALGYVMKRERSLDIDSDMDFRLFEFLLKESRFH